METETDALRRAAPSWSLADDKRLLDALQKMHDKLLTKCNDTSSQLSTMCNALTDAALALDNVNNRFMSLSNSQFVERRVYDDDADVAVPADDVTSQKSTEQPQATSESPADNIKRALKVLEDMHESFVILADSDSDSGSDGDEDTDRMVLKPKDVYRERPLPHIIGTKAWKSKWHAGVLPDKSESDTEESDASRCSDQYSDNERYSPESLTGNDVRQGLVPALKDEMSSSSEVMSEHEAPSQALPAMSPADIAAELARRLQGPQTAAQPPQPVIEESPPQMPRKLYKPEIPPPGTIFSDEPPPLDSDHDDDIFAELRKNKPYSHTNTAQDNVAKDLFGVKGTDDIDVGSEEDGDIFSDLVPGVNKSKPAPALRQTVSSLQNRSDTRSIEPLPVTETYKPERDEQQVEKSSNKKPVGGISVFGGGQHSAIGAAILQRQRQAASGDDTDGSDIITVPKQTTEKSESRKESVKEKENTQKDIFEDLFARTEKVTKKKVVNEPIVKEYIVVKKENKVDLFSDNLFDDIDDIFTSNIVTKVPVHEAVTKNSEKSLFDDEDDLFKDIAVANTSTKYDEITIENKTIAKEKTDIIFDSEDDLFSDKPLQKRAQNTEKLNKSKNIKASETIGDTTRIDMTSKSKNSKTIFDSDEDLFLDNKPKTKLNEESKELNEESKELNEESKELNEESVDVRNESKNIFNDSNDGIFSGIKAVKDKQEKRKTQADEIGAKSQTISNAKVFKDEIIFEDDDDDSLFKDKPAIITSQQGNTAKKDIIENDDNFFKLSPKPESKENIADTDEKSFEKNVKYPKIAEDKSQSAIKQSVENVLKSDVSHHKQFGSSEVKTNIDVLSDSDAQFSDIMNVTEKEVISEIVKEKMQDIPVTNNENDTAKSDVTKNINVQIEDDDLDIFKAVNLSQKDAKPEISRKPTLGSDQGGTKNVKSKTSLSDEIAVDTEKIMEPGTHQKPRHETDQEGTKYVQNEEKLQKVSEVNDNVKIYKVKANNMKGVDSNKNITSNVTIDTPNTKVNESKLNTPNMLSETLNDLPPVFEKPKEPKRSKNVNALFDDDSDDEALFYRKSDATLDDVPSVEKKDSICDDRFQLFLDEPPAIDEDFEQITNKKNSESSQEHTDVSGHQSDVGLTETSDSVNLISDEIDTYNTEIAHKATNNLYDEKLGTKTKMSNNIDSDEELFSSKRNSVKAEQTDIKTKNHHEQTMVGKKIGKLQHLNLNINVNTLFPGASPKKSVKTQEQIDGHTFSSQSTEDLHSKVTFEDKEIKSNETCLVKSVSFDGDPESSVLDNKLSKERAKIKVKRRPSSRRARHEAARKSGIEFGQDSTENSSPVDDILRSTDVADNSYTKTENNKENLDGSICYSLSEDSKIREEIIKNVIQVNENKSKSLDSNNADKKDIACNDKITQEHLMIPEHSPQVSPTRDMKSKVVYILNDEDIFSEPKPQKPSDIVSKKKLNIVDDDDDDIFKSITPATKIATAEAKTEAAPIKTLGNVYKAQTDYESDDDIFKDKQKVKRVSKSWETIENSEKLEVEPREILSKVIKTNEVLSKQNTDVKTKTSIFDDLSDEENKLFNTKQTQALPENKFNKNALFDSDSESELFTGKSKKETKNLGVVGKKEMKRVEVKGSLFGDDDDDDLFGAKSKSASPFVSSSSSTRMETGVQPHNSTSDPLSLLLDPK